MKETCKLINVFDDVMRWDDQNAKLEFLARLMGILQVEEQYDYLRESFINTLLQQYNRVKPARYITTQCVFCGSSYKVDCHLFNLFCPYCGNSK